MAAGIDVERGNGEYYAGFLKNAKPLVKAQPPLHLFQNLLCLAHIKVRKDTMSRTCDLCGKHTMTGNKVSHAKNRTRRTWKPNLVKVKTEVEGTTFTVKLCARCLKSDFITKKV
jgi:large subunit ribosomal protein L28